MIIETYAWIPVSWIYNLSRRSQFVCVYFLPPFWVIVQQRLWWWQCFTLCSTKIGHWGQFDPYLGLANSRLAFNWGSLSCMQLVILQPSCGCFSFSKCIVWASSFSESSWRPLVLWNTLKFAPTTNQKNDVSQKDEYFIFLIYKPMIL